MPDDWDDRDEVVAAGSICPLSDCGALVISYSPPDRTEMGEMACYEDDAASTPHQPQCSIYKVDLCIKVQLHGIISGLVLLQAATSVQDKKVELSPRSLNLVKGCGNVLGVCDVRLNKKRSSPHSTQLVSHRLGFWPLTSIVDGNIYSEVTKLPGYARSNSPRGARHQGGPS
jgi:hypothetical protein